MLSSALVRIKVWTASRRAVDSDAPSLIGPTFKLGADELDALHGGPVVGLSNLQDPENVNERHLRQFVQVISVSILRRGPGFSVRPIYRRSTSEEHGPFTLPVTKPQEQPKRVRRNISPRIE